MKLLNMKKTMNMNEDKTMMNMKVRVDIQSRMNMKKSTEKNAKLNMKSILPMLIRRMKLR